MATNRENIHRFPLIGAACLAMILRYRGAHLYMSLDRAARQLEMVDGVEKKPVSFTGARFYGFLAKEKNAPISPATVRWEGVFHVL